MDEDKKYFLAFSAFPGIGPLRFRLLYQYFGSAKAAWQANKKELLKIGLGDKLTEAFVKFRETFSLATFVNLLKDKNIWLLTYLDKDYPALLKEISTAPFLLYIRGKRDLDWDLSKTIGIVGTRKMTSYGKQVTEKITSELAGQGMIIVSGMAYGIDSVAHQTAISQGGKTIAVLGCGVDIIHPISNTLLYRKIINDGYGWVISEFPVGLYASKGLFPARNRIISGLSLGVVVTEGAQDSGALITARFAAEQGREVFAVPGPITSSMSQAPTILLKQGAKLVTKAEDILEELNLKYRKGEKKKLLHDLKNLSADERYIIRILENENLSFDEIIRKTSFSAQKLLTLLTMLEMKGLVKKSEGSLYGICS